MATCRSGKTPPLSSPNRFGPERRNVDLAGRSARDLPAVFRQAYLTDDEPPEIGLLLPVVR
jgi:hypothetical protein